MLLFLKLNCPYVVFAPACRSAAPRLVMPLLTGLRRWSGESMTSPYWQPPLCCSAKLQSGLPWPTVSISGMPVFRQPGNVGLLTFHSIQSHHHHHITLQIVFMGMTPQELLSGVQYVFCLYLFQSRTLFRSWFRPLRECPPVASGG